MNKIKKTPQEVIKFIKIVLHSLLHIIRLFSFITPRNRNFWLLGSFGGSFNDNAKYLFIYIHNNHPEIKIAWISNNKKTVSFLREKSFSAYYKWSIQGIYYSLVAGVYIYNAYINDINSWTYGRAVKVNLWHGFFAKKIEFDIKKGVLAPVFNNSLKSRLLYPKEYIKPDFVLSASEKMSELFSSAFRINSAQCLNFGYTRNNILQLPKNDIKTFIKNNEPPNTLNILEKLTHYKKIYVYMPTWRDNHADFIENSGICFETLNDLMIENNHFFIFKVHNNTHIEIDLSQYPNIFLFDNKSDIYPLLPFTDVLITDYSSICLDYKVMNKNVIFYCFDEASYLEEREMYFDYQDVLKGETVARTFNELLQCIQKDASYQQPKTPNTLMQQLIPTGKNSSKNSSKKLVDFIKKHVKIK